MIFLLLDISQCFGKKGELYYMIENAQPLCRHLLIHVSIATDDSPRRIRLRW